MKTLILKNLLIAGLLAWTALPAGADPGQEQDLLDVLRSSADPVQKADAAGRLRGVGTVQVVPVLAALLNDDATAHAARHALEGMPFPEAGAALRQALGQSTGLLKLGLIDSLGWRREVEAVSLLQPMLSETDAALVAATAIALGRIGSAGALSALEAARHQIPAMARPALLEGLMRCAERQLAEGNRVRASAIYRSIFDSSEVESIRAAAYAGMIRSADDGGFGLIVAALGGRDAAAGAAALQLAGGLQHPAATRALSELLPNSPPGRQVALLALLQARGDAAAMPVVLTAARSAEPAVRAAAASALGALGDATCVTLLAESAEIGRAHV